MEIKRIKRRSFLQSSMIAVSGEILIHGVTQGLTNPPAIPDLIKIKEPFNGAVLNRRHGRKTERGLYIDVQGDAPLNSNVVVNGQPAKREGTKFISEVILREQETKITAISDGWFGRNEHTIRVLWDKHSYPRYCYEIDDNIFFFRDIAHKKYNSLFDCFYLNGLRKLNQKYGTKFVLNIYYTDEEGFDLTQFPDRYKSEWEDNASWLRLAFHAYANDPARPYQYAPPQKLIADLDLVNDQIHRFAGDQTFTPPSVIHWSMNPPSAFKPLASRGVRVLRGIFRYINGSWDAHCGLDDIRAEYLSRHYALKDFESGLIFAKGGDVVGNLTPIYQIVPALEVLKQNSHRAEIIDLSTHEQYFWSFYSRYIPDHFQRLDIALHWVTENGYKPVFIHEGFLGIE